MAKLKMGKRGSTLLDIGCGRLERPVHERRPFSDWEDRNRDVDILCLGKVVRHCDDVEWYGYKVRK